MFRILGLLLMLPAVAGAARAQPAPAERVEAVWAAYRSLEYDVAERQAMDALEADEDLSDVQAAQLYEVLGLIAYLRDDPDAARRFFETALSLDPALALDPLLVPPKILDFFAEVRRGWQVVPRRPPQIVHITDPRAEAALRSLLVPGWGQRYKGETTRGILLMGAWTATTATALAAHLRADALHDDAPAGPDAPARDGQGWRTARNVLLAGGAALWLYAYVDALTGAVPTRDRRTAVRVVPGQAGLQLALRRTF